MRSLALITVFIQLVIHLDEIVGYYSRSLNGSPKKLNLSKSRERSASLSSLYEEHSQWDRPIGSSVDVQQRPWYMKFPRIQIIIAEKLRTLHIIGMETYVGCSVYFEPSTSAYYEILPIIIGDKPLGRAAPVEYHEESAAVMRILADLPGHSYFPAPIDTMCTYQGNHYSVSKFRLGISLENIFYTKNDHELKNLMLNLRERILTDFPFFLAQLITIFEILSGSGVFYGKVECRMISLLSNGYMELVDLRQAFRPYQQRRKYVSASMPWAPPEVRSGKKVGPYSHFYSLGGLVYELVTRKKFSAINADHRKLGFPLDISPDLKTIIEDLLTVDYEQRIATLSRIKVSPFFTAINWIAVRQGTEPSPITLNFEQ
jgi:hypothetical protein